MRRSLPTLSLAGLVLHTGCFTDYAPHIGREPVVGGSSGTGTSGPAADAMTTGTGTTGTTGSDLFVASHGEPGSSSTSAATTLADPDLPAHDLAECLANAQGFTCVQCVCDHCAAEFLACGDDPGCVAIEQCAFVAGCNGGGCLGPCGDVIDQHGGADGPSVALAQAFSLCFDTNCAC